MRVRFTRDAEDDYQYFKKSGNKQIINKIKDLLESIVETPYEGIGQPELLKYNFQGTWSRRINREHRLIYQIDGEIINVLSLKGHYN